MGRAMYSKYVIILYRFLQQIKDYMIIKCMCEQCGKHCKKSFKKAFCGDLCRFMFYKEKDPQTNCWIWKGRIKKDGYGSIMISGKRVSAHRFSYEQFCGEIPKGSLVLHSCHNPPCVNPEHLRVGTIYENSMDMVEAKRHLYGEKGTASKLKEEDVREIRKLYSQGDISQQSLANFYKVSQVAIGALLRGVTWKHVI